MKGYAYGPTRNVIHAFFFYEKKKRNGHLINAFWLSEGGPYGKKFDSIRTSCNVAPDREAYIVLHIFRPALPLSQQVHGIYFLVCLRVLFRKQSNNMVPLLQWSLVGPWKPSQHNFGVLHCSMTSLKLDDTQFFDPKVIQNVTLLTMLATFASVLRH